MFEMKSMAALQAASAKSKHDNSVAVFVLWILKQLVEQPEVVIKSGWDQELFPDAIALFRANGYSAGLVGRDLSVKFTDESK